MDKDTSVTRAEDFIGLLMAVHEEKLRSAYAAGRRPMRGMAIQNGLGVPSARLMGLVWLSAELEIPFEQGLALSTNGADPGFRNKLNQRAKTLQLVFGDGASFASSWLQHFARAEGMNEFEARYVLSFHGEEGSGSEADLRPELIEKSFRKHCESRRGSSSNSRDIDAKRFLAGLRVTKPPTYYRPHLEMRMLAQTLTASELKEGWQKDLGVTSGLYSDLAGGSGEPVLDQLQDLERGVLLGDPGYGKSTALGAFVVQRTDDGHPCLTVRLDELGELAQEREFARTRTPEDAAALVLEVAERRLAGTCSPQTKKAILGMLLHDPEFLLAFDGLDEISSPSRRNQVIQLLGALDGIRGRILVASRITGYSLPLPSATELVVNPLDPEAVDKFFVTWFCPDLNEVTDEDALGLARARAALSSGSGLTDIASIPLLAGFICYVASHEDVALTKTGLYQQYLSRFLRREWKGAEQQRDSPGEILSVIEIATQTAGVMSTQPGEDGTREPRWADHMSLSELAFDPRLGPRIEPVALLASEEGLLVPNDLPRGEDPVSQAYRWLHRTLHEHLTGRWLAQRIRTEQSSIKPFLKAAVLRPGTWAVALEHCAGYLGSMGGIELLVDALQELEDSGDSRAHVFGSAKAASISASGTQFRRLETISELFANQEYYTAFSVDRSLSTVKATEELEQMSPEHRTRLGYSLDSANPAEYTLGECILALDGGRDNAVLLREQIDAQSKTDLHAAQSRSLRALADGQITWISSDIFVDASDALVDVMIDSLGRHWNSPLAREFFDALCAVGSTYARLQCKKVLEERGGEPLLLDWLDETVRSLAKNQRPDDPSPMHLISSQKLPPFAASAVGTSASANNLDLPPEDQLLSTVLAAIWRRSLDNDVPPYPLPYIAMENTRAILAQTLENARAGAVTAESSAAFCRAAWQAIQAVDLESLPMLVQAWSLEEDLDTGAAPLVSSYALASKFQFFPHEEVLTLLARSTAERHFVALSNVLLNMGAEDAEAAIMFYLDKLFRAQSATPRLEVYSSLVPPGRAPQLARKVLDTVVTSSASVELRLSALQRAAEWLVQDDALPLYWDELLQAERTIIESTDSEAANGD
ncbi:NACHT domain-containing protein [Pseudoclavibacter helvolus]|uniref:NACHT domain-containing protein n=1 Tax=Pseudoclavibacter helvolus TaxID=255205 RepID=A0A7W4YF43_9MICO|nr:hypothetical protein [Pseudoclavibacter helvolus]MBB2957887.1 hypothetical protein [Pseudoclavibacter helvolus]